MYFDFEFWSQVFQMLKALAVMWFLNIFELVFSHLVTQIWIKISPWNFQYLFVICLCKFDKKNFTIAQSACLPQLVLAKTLDASSNHICCDILNRKKWRGSGPNGAASWKDFSISLKNGVMKSFESPFKMFTDGKHLKAYEMACRGLALHMRFNAWQCLHRGSFRGRLKYNLLGFALLLGVEPGDWFDFQQPRC